MSDPDRLLYEVREELHRRSRRLFCLGHDPARPNYGQRTYLDMYRELERVCVTRNADDARKLAAWVGVTW